MALGAPDYSDMMLKMIGPVVFEVVFFGVILFAPAGTLHWAQAWIFLAVTLLACAIAMFTVFPGQEDLLKERYASPVQAGQPLSDKVIVLSMVASYIANTAFIPVDVFRLHLLAPPNAAIQYIGLLVYIAGWTLTAAAMKTNPFAAPVVKHMKERNQRVVDSGVYGVIRHPMYAGGFLLAIGAPLWLGSYAAALLAITFVGIGVARIFIEEAFLRRELAGYDQYTHRIRYRLIPGVW